MPQYVLAEHPEWTAEELRDHLALELRRVMGPRDRDRLRGLDCADWVPTSTAAAAAISAPGPMVQIAGFLCYASNENEGKAFRIIVPKLIRWRDMAKLVEQLRISMRNICKLMRKEEASAYLRAVPEIGESNADRSGEPVVNPASDRVEVEPASGAQARAGEPGSEGVSDGCGDAAAQLLPSAVRDATGE